MKVEQRSRGQSNGILFLSHSDNKHQSNSKQNSTGLTETPWFEFLT